MTWALLRNYSAGFLTFRLLRLDVLSRRHFGGKQGQDGGDQVRQDDDLKRID